MPNKQKHRGMHPKDERLFNEKNMLLLREAQEHLSFLLSRKYNDSSALELVGNRFQFDLRQRKALRRISCPDIDVQNAREKASSPSLLAGKRIAVDGFNLLISLETAMGGGLIFECRDGCLRDIASVHGSYRRMEETAAALLLVGEELERLQVASVHWFLDAPVSNSGKLRGQMLELATEKGFNWSVELAYNPDREVVKEDWVVVSSDAWVIGESQCWFNLARHLILEMEGVNLR